MKGPAVGERGDQVPAPPDQRKNKPPGLVTVQRQQLTQIRPSGGQYGVDRIPGARFVGGSYDHDVNGSGQYAYGSAEPFSTATYGTTDTLDEDSGPMAPTVSDSDLLAVGGSFSMDFATLGSGGGERKFVAMRAGTPKQYDPPESDLLADTSNPP